SFLSRYRRPPPLHSFPTRRSSDLQSNSGHSERADAPRGQWQLFNAEQCLETPGGARLRLTSQEHHMISILGRSQNEVFAKEALRSEEHTSELQSRENLVCRLLLEK